MTLAQKLVRWVGRHCSSSTGIACRDFGQFFFKVSAQNTNFHWPPRLQCCIPCSEPSSLINFLHESTFCLIASRRNSGLHQHSCSLFTSFAGAFCGAGLPGRVEWIDAVDSGWEARWRGYRYLRGRWQAAGGPPSAVESNRIALHQGYCEGITTMSWCQESAWSWIMFFPAAWLIILIQLSVLQFTKSQNWRLKVVLCNVLDKTNGSSIKKMVLCQCRSSWWWWCDCFVWKPIESVECSSFHLSQSPCSFGFKASKIDILVFCVQSTCVVYWLSTREHVLVHHQKSSFVLLRLRHDSHEFFFWWPSMSH